MYFLYIYIYISAKKFVT